MGGSGGGLAVVDDRGWAFAGGGVDQHEPAPAEISCRRMRHRESQTDRDRGIHRIAAIEQNTPSHLGGKRLLRNHHGVRGTNWIFSAGRRRES